MNQALQDAAEIIGRSPTNQEVGMNAALASLNADIHAGREEAITGNDPGDESDAPAELAPPVRARFEEWHVTVVGVSPVDWFVFCDSVGIKPLFIELNDGALQLMCAADFDPREVINDYIKNIPGARVVREKFEVSELRGNERALYYEAHLKFDGRYRPEIQNTSRDLYRLGNRWYVTRRDRKRPIDLQDFGERGRVIAGKGAMVGGEAEIVVYDSNPGLDGHWAAY